MLTLGILVAVFILITLISSKFPISAADKPGSPALRILSVFPLAEQPGFVRIFAERF